MILSKRFLNEQVQKRVIREDTNSDKFWIHDGLNKYVTRSGWLNGTSPYIHE